MTRQYIDMSRNPLLVFISCSLKQRAVKAVVHLNIEEGTDNMMFGYLMHSKKFAGWVSTLSVFKNVVANYPDFTCKIYICDSTD